MVQEMAEESIRWLGYGHVMICDTWNVPEDRSIDALSTRTTGKTGKLHPASAVRSSWCSQPGSAPSATQL